MSKPDFGPGDLVVCVDVGEIIFAGFIHEGGDRLVFGRAYRCVWLRDIEGFPACGLAEVRSKDRTGGFLALRFRKIDKADEQFTAQIRACKPVKQREPA